TRRSSDLRSNIDAQISDRFKIGVSLSARKEDREFATQSAGNIFRSIYRAYPTISAIYPNGMPSTGIENNNPVVMVQSMAGTDKQPTYVFNGILTAKYDLPFLKGLSVDGFFSVDELSRRRSLFSTPYTLYNYNSDSDSFEPIVAGGGPDQQAALDEEHFNQSMTVANIKLNFNRTFNNHSFDAFIGFEMSESKNHTLG